MTRDVLLFEYEDQKFKVSLLAARGIFSSSMIPIEDEAGTAQLIRDFVEGGSCRKPHVLLLIPRSLVVMTIFHLPSKDPSELRQMAELQISRRIPHKISDMVMGFSMISKEKDRQSLVVCTVVSRFLVDPLLRILQAAQCSPDVVGLSVFKEWAWLRRSLPSQKHEDILLVFQRHGAATLLVCRNGALVFGRDGVTGEGMVGVLAEVEDILCDVGSDRRREVLITDTAGFLTEKELKMMGRPVETRDVEGGLSATGRAVLRSHGLDAALAVTFSELTSGEIPFDLSPEETRRARLDREKRQTWIHVSVIMTVMVFFFVAGQGAILTRKNFFVGELRRRHAQVASGAEELERQHRTIVHVREKLSRRIRVDQVLAAITRALPDDVRVEEILIKGGDQLAIRGIASGIEKARAFREKLGQEPLWVELEISGMVTRPTETASEVTFCLTGRLARGDG